MKETPKTFSLKNAWLPSGIPQLDCFFNHFQNPLVFIKFPLMCLTFPLASLRFPFGFSSVSLLVSFLAPVPPQIKRQGLLPPPPPPIYASAPPGGKWRGGQGGSLASCGAAPRSHGRKRFAQSGGVRKNKSGQVDGFPRPRNPNHYAHVWPSFPDWASGTISAGRLFGAVASIDGMVTGSHAPIKPERSTCYFTNLTWAVS